MTEYLAFVDEIGRTLDGDYVYRFDLTTDKDTVWGEFFNVVPSAIIPNIQPDKNTLSRSAKVVFPRRMAIAKNSYCFSMQDCIDLIMPIIFSEIDENTLEIEGVPFFLNFGDTIEEIETKLKAIGTEMFDFEEVKKGDESAIDDLIDSMDDNNDKDEYF